MKCTTTQDRDVGSSDSSAFETWWAEHGSYDEGSRETVMPYALKAWDAAIRAAASHVRGQGLTALEIADGTKWSNDSTEHIAAKMQADLSGPNAKFRGAQSPEAPC